MKLRYNEKFERNKEIYQDRLNGMSWFELMKKYNLASKTLSIIVKNMERKLAPVIQDKN